LPVHELVKEGKVPATLGQHAVAIFGIEYALELLKTQAKAADRETPVDLIKG